MGDAQSTLTMRSDNDPWQRHLNISEWYLVAVLLPPAIATSRAKAFYVDDRHAS
jgi:hypothetical protein